MWAVCQQRTIDLADPAHRLRVGADHADDAAVVEDVLGADRLGPDAALGEGHVLGDRPRQVMADHQHVEVLVDRVDGERPGRVGARGQDVGQAGDLDDVRGVAAAGPLGVVGVDRPALDRGDRVLDEPGLVERVGVDGDLDVVLVGHRQAGVDGGGRGAPVLVELQAAGAGLGSGRPSGSGRLPLPLPRKPTLIGSPSAAWSIRIDVPGARACRSSPRCRWPSPVPPPISVVMPEAMAVSICCGQMKWMWRVDAAGRADHALAGDDLGARPDDQPRVDARLGQRVARLADGHDPAVADADVALDDPPVVDDHRVGDDQVAVRRAHRLVAAGTGPGRRGSTCRRRRSTPRRRRRSPSRSR